MLDAMDRFEGVAVGKYVRETIPVKIALGDDGDPPMFGEFDAVAYIATSDEFNEPSAKYLQAVLKTIRAFWTVNSVKDITVE
jgi:hypothetical protein